MGQTCCTAAPKAGAGKAKQVGQEVKKADSVIGMDAGVVVMERKGSLMPGMRVHDSRRNADGTLVEQADKKWVMVTDTGAKVEIEPAFIEASLPDDDLVADLHSIPDFEASVHSATFESANSS
eukprot:TRINITY_DN3700_c0_g2_i1.p2 TRINITY_DN3700_c0_g2~~TRINITY_DN3700_c0_g2_i1.p2  ORF type:complete len:139 (+),score=49.14 TRINITY_DN3700_c0_g2_i1:51-419(+)